MPKTAVKPFGLELKNLRNRLGLTLRQVEEASRRLVGQSGDNRYFLSSSLVANMENHGITPSIFKFFSLSVIYNLPLREILSIFGVDFELCDIFADYAHTPGTHPVDLLGYRGELRIPLRFDPHFNRQHTALLNRLVETWGVLPFEFFRKFNLEKFIYAFIGESDNLMHPMLRCGAIVKVDPNKVEVKQSGWSNEFDRPIYLVETHAGYRCAWCFCDGRHLVLVPHPLSMRRQEEYLHKQEAEVIGQVIGVLMNIQSLGEPEG